MSFRVSAIIAAVVVLESGALNPAGAQPQAPVRPRNTQFQSVFGGGRPIVANPAQGFLGQNQPVVNPNGPQVPGFAYPGQGLYPQGLNGTTAVDPQIRPTGVVGSFNNLGHWYGGNTGSYGHWYPNGIANGRGVLGYGGGNGTFGAGGSVGPTVGNSARSGGLLNSVGGTALGVGAAVGSFRR
ncbi:unnamed protein product [Gemmata massiliana]|uniref:Uncharacterized protein n=1 Tax=Gemmata massiliana TaxID=1210884 RepID=A0A6P2DD80_9BACT|nr:hypothetical protein [Gemmata massiliana]VTS00023.1 unnamed protein product [Gemmata massiliana]